eukprot:5497865-Amphidinium_carterae.1
MSSTSTKRKLLVSSGKKNPARTNSAKRLYAGAWVSQAYKSTKCDSRNLCGISKQCSNGLIETVFAVHDSGPREAGRLANNAGSADSATACLLRFPHSAKASFLISLCRFALVRIRLLPNQRNPLPHPCIISRVSLPVSMAQYFNEGTLFGNQLRSGVATGL